MSTNSSPQTGNMNESGTTSLANTETQNEQRTGPLFFAEINDAYSTRNLIEYLKATNVHGNFVFSKDRIVYCMSDATQTILNEIVILGCNLTRYVYNSSNEYEIVGMTISNLRKITKSIGKKDSICLYMLHNDPLLYIQIMSNNAKASRNNINIIKPQQSKDNDLYDTSDLEYQRTEDNPNCTVPVIDFCRMCTAMNSIQCSYVTIRGLPKGVIFEGIMEGGLTGRIDQFGICKGYNTNGANGRNEEIDLAGLLEDIRVDQIKMPTKAPKLVIQSEDVIETRIKVKIETIKALAKINNLTSGGTGIIKLYIEEGLPLKLIMSIGNYGKLTIYLRDMTTS